MKQLRDTVWQRVGTSWLWDADALSQVCSAQEVWTLRQFIHATGNWPESLPSNDNNTLVVAGLEGCMDLLSLSDAENWLGSEVKESILSFQQFYDGQAALVFWLPSGAGRIVVNPATDAVGWRCTPPNSHEKIDFGRILWGEATEYPQEILLQEAAKPSGLFHRRIT